MSRGPCFISVPPYELEQMQKKTVAGEMGRLCSLHSRSVKQPAGIWRQGGNGTTSMQGPALKLVCAQGFLSGSTHPPTRRALPLAPTHLTGGIESITPRFPHPPCYGKALRAVQGFSWLEIESRREREIGGRGGGHRAQPQLSSRNSCRVSGTREPL